MEVRVHADKLIRLKAHGNFNFWSKMILSISRFIWVPYGTSSINVTKRRIVEVGLSWSAASLSLLIFSAALFGFFSVLLETIITGKIQGFQLQACWYGVSISGAENFSNLESLIRDFIQGRCVELLQSTYVVRLRQYVVLLYLFMSIWRYIFTIIFNNISRIIIVITHINLSWTLNSCYTVSIISGW